MHPTSAPSAEFSTQGLNSSNDDYGLAKDSLEATPEVAKHYVFS